MKIKVNTKIKFKSNFGSRSVARDRTTPVSI